MRLGAFQGVCVRCLYVQKKLFEELNCEEFPLSLLQNTASTQGIAATALP